MFCANCGKQIEDGSTFCGLCGAPQSSAPNQLDDQSQQGFVQPDPQRIPMQQEQLRPDQLPVNYPQPGQNQFQPAAYPGYQPAPAYNNTAVPRKKKKKGCLIALIILLVLLLGIGYLGASMLGLFGPKNLGVDYDEDDYTSAMEKIGTEIIYDGMSGDELREHTQVLKKKKVQYPIADFEWIHEDFQRRQFELTSSEATALINEIAPAFFWFERVQIDAQAGGEVRASGTLRLRKALEDHYPELIDDVPFPVFRKVNLYASGGIEITNNQLSLNSEEFKTGEISGISAEMLNENAHYFEPLYTSIPGLEIYSLKVTQEGTIAVDALIPQRSTVRRISQ